jgi:hypothetical protein
MRLKTKTIRDLTDKRKAKWITAFITVILFLCSSCGNSGKNYSDNVHHPKDSTFRSEMLKDTKWGTELAHGYERRIFSDSTMTTVRVYPRSGITDTTVYYYYLSDHYIPSKFDFSRVGKATCGQYLILHHIGITTSWQLLWIGMSNMEIRYTDIGDTIRYLRIQ